MPRRPVTALIAACALIALWASSASGVIRYAEIPITNLGMTINAGVTPKKLPRVEATPIALDIGGRIETLDGSHPPAVRMLVLDLDRHIAIDGRGLPACKGGQRDLRYPELRLRCKDAIVGRGRVRVQIQFPGLPSTSSKSDLIVFNVDAAHGRKTTLYAAARLTEPINTSFAMPIEIARRPHGNRAVIEVPQVANGAGSLTYLSATLKRRFTRDGEVVDFLTASCPNGKLQSGARALFADGTILQVDSLQTCTPRD